MNNQDYTTSITAKVSAEEAFNSISNVSKWWAKNFEGKAQNQGDSFTVRFGETFVTFKIAESIAGKKSVWLVTDCHLHWLNDKTEWTGTKIVWDIATKNDAEQVTMTHVGLIPGMECYDTCENGWNGHIQKSLLNLMTEGVGSPE
jgi:hypothetical protein